MIVLNGDSGITTPSYGGTDTAEYLVPVTAFKNRIINGAMMVSQRSGTATQTINNTTAYSLDRWAVNFTGGSGTVQQVTGTGGFKYAMRLTGGSGITFGFISQKIESYNIYDCASSTVTYKIRASSSTLTTLNWNARFPTTQDNYAGVTAISNGSITINSTPTDYTFQIALPAGVTNGFEVYFDFGSFTSGTLDITGVQLEKGSTATSFDYRPYGQELMLCQRYYYRLISTLGLTQGTSNLYNSSSWIKTSMRATPTLDAGSAVTSVASGSLGTLAIFSGTGVTNSGEGVYLYNSSGNWSANIQVSGDVRFNAEL